MKIIVRDISPKGLELSEEVEASSLGLLPDDLKFISPIKIRAQISRVEDTILACTHVQACYSFFCSRCLESVETDRRQKFDFAYRIENGLDSIDLSEDIRQEIILTAPTRILCDKNCKGICPQCGANLNKETCKCTIKEK